MGVSTRAHGPSLPLPLADSRAPRCSDVAGLGVKKGDLTQEKRLVIYPLVLPCHVEGRTFLHATAATRETPTASVGAVGWRVCGLYE